MRKYLLRLLFLLILPTLAFARGSLSGYCTQGGQKIITNAVPSTTQVMQSYPQCSVTVFYTGGPSGSVTTAGTAVTWTGGTLFNANGQWSGLPISINGTFYTISSCSSTTACTLTGSAGTNSSPVAYFMNATAPAAIFTSNGSTLTNPFVGTTQGYWQFYTNNGQYDVQLSAGGFPVPITWGAQSVIDPLGMPVLNVKTCGVKGDNTTNDTNAIQACIVTATTLGYSLYFPAGTYRICAVNPSIPTGANVVVYGDGPKVTMFTTHSSCLAQATNMLSIQTTGAVYLHDFGIDSLNNTSAPFSGADIVIGNSNTTVNASQVIVDHLYVAHGQVVGLQLSCDSNVTVSNSTFYQNWWYGISEACSLGGTTAPIYTYNHNFHGNTYIQDPIGLGLSFFLSNVSITGETFEYSSLALVQTPHLYGSASGLSFTNAPNYGCTTQCGYPAVMNAVYGEGASDFDIGDVHLSNWSGVQGGISFFGSNVQLPEGGGAPVMDLAINNVSIHGIHADNIAGWPIWVQALSNGPSPSLGSLVTIKDSWIANSPTCGVFSNVIGWEYSSVYCDNISSNGLSINAQNGAFINNRFHNIGTGSTGTYVGLSITGNSASPSLNNYVEDNEFVDDSGNSMLLCVNDSQLSTGAYASMTKSKGNRCAGAVNAWSPAPAVPHEVTGTPAFTGSGLNDATFAGTFSGTDDTFNVVITSTGTPDVFKWNKNGGSYTTGVSITGSSQALADGTTVTFGATTGHTVNNAWTVGYTSGGQGWYAGDTIQNFSTVTGVPLLWTNQTAGAGTWLATGYLGNSGTVAVTVCGSGAAFTNGTANQFVIQVGTGTITACTITWAHAFSGTPIITGLSTTGSGLPYITSLSSSILVLHFTGAADGQFVSVSAW